MQTFLTNRTKKLVVDGSSSESAHVKSGVPRSTVFESLLPIKCRSDQEQLQSLGSLGQYKKPRIPVHLNRQDKNQRLFNAIPCINETLK